MGTQPNDPNFIQNWLNDRLANSGLNPEILSAIKDSLSGPLGDKLDSSKLKQQLIELASEDRGEK